MWTLNRKHGNIPQGRVNTLIQTAKTELMPTILQPVRSEELFIANQAYLRVDQLLLSLDVGLYHEHHVVEGVLDMVGAALEN